MIDVMEEDASYMVVETYKVGALRILAGGLSLRDRAYHAPAISQVQVAALAPKAFTMTNLATSPMCWSSAAKEHGRIAVTRGYTTIE